MNWLLFAGIVLRLAVLITAGPNNPDRHIDVIAYTVEHGWVPASNLILPDGFIFAQSYHPPLYYLLMAPLFAMLPYEQTIHFVSFVLSCLNLWMIRRLLDHPAVAVPGGGRLIALAIAAFVPEFVMFSGFISNDALALPLGTLVFWMMLRYLSRPTRNRLIVLAVMVGLGLLTKGTFILTGAALALLVIFVESRNCRRHAAGMTMIFVTIWALLGCYKYAENYVTHGHPIVHNLDMGGLIFEAQGSTWKGMRSIYDVNVVKLIRRPILKERDTFSYPLLMYASFWYPHIPESSYEGNWHGYAWVGSIIYALAVVPTVIFLIGMARAVAMAFAALRAPRAARITDLRALVAAGSLLLFVSNLVVIFAAGIKYDLWWCFQSRLWFQSMLPALVFLGLGCEMLPKQKWLMVIVQTLCWATVAACILYFGVEIALSQGWLALGPAIQP